MTKIKVSKQYAAIIYGAILVISIIGTVLLLSNNNNPFYLKICGLLFATVGLIISIFGLYSLFNKKKFLYDTQNEPITSSSVTELSYTYSSTKEAIHISIKSLQKVLIKTTDQGPFDCDVFIILLDKSGKEFITPQDHKYANVVVDWILKLQNFNHETFIDAMGCSDNKYHEVWINNPEKE